MPLKSWQWKTMVEQKAHGGKLWKLLGKDQFLQKIWEYFCLERVKKEKCRHRLHSQNDKVWKLCIEERRLGGIRKNLHSCSERDGVDLVQRIMLKSTECLQRIIAPAGGQGGVTLSYCAHIAIVFLLRIIFGGQRQQMETTTKKKDCSWWCAHCGPNSLLVVQTGDSASQAKVFKAHNALKLFANQEKDGDNRNTPV